MSYLLVKQSKGIQEGFPILTATEKHQCILVPLLVPEAGAEWKGLHELSLLAWTQPTVSGVVLEEVRAVQQVYPVLPARKGSPQRVDSTAVHKRGPTKGFLSTILLPVLVTDCTAQEYSPTWTTCIQFLRGV